MISFMLGLALLAGGEPAGGQENASVEALKPIGFLVGTWTASEKDGAEHEYRTVWMHNRTSMKSEYVSKGPDGRVTWTATSILGYDQELKTIVAFVFARNGAIARTRAVPSRRKNVWVFKGTISGDWPFKEDRVTYTKVDDDTFTAKVEVKEGERYRDLGTTTYTRKK